MIKKSTLLILTAAILIGAAAYYFDWKRGQKEDAKPAEDTSKLAFTIKPDDISTITITRPAAQAESVIQFGKRNADWQITQPLQTAADQPTLNGLVTLLSTARIAQTEPGTPDRLKVYGLDPPAATIDFQMANGDKHSAKLGNKDFVGSSVYAQIDSAKDVALLPNSLLLTAQRPLQDLRDTNVLRLAPAQVSSIDLKNGSGELVASKDKDGWKFSKPSAASADGSSIDSLLSTVSTAKMATVVSETPDNLAKYGLATPQTSFAAAGAKSNSATLIVGKKDGNEYFARDTSRPMIFKINEELHKKLSQNFADLRDKRLLRLDPATITHIDIQNPDGAISATRKNDDEWTFDAPSDVEGKPASGEKVFSPLEQARAEQIFDNPPAILASKLTKPAVEIVLTSKDGKKLTIAISKEADGFVYARTSDGPVVYKIKKQVLDDLTFKAADMAF